MFRSFRSTILVLTVAAAIVPTIGISLFATRRITAIVEGNAERELGAIAERAATELRNQLTATVARAHALGRDSDVERATHSVLFVERAELLFDRFLSESPLTSAVVLLNTRGRATAWAPLQATAPVAKDLLDSVRPWLANQEHVKAGAHRLETLESNVTLLVPIAGIDGRTVGELVILVPETRLQELIARQMPVGVAAQLLAGRADANQQVAGTVQASSRFELTKTPFAVTVSEPRATRFAVVRSTVITLVAATLATVLILALIAYLIARMISRPLAALEQQVSHYSAGRYDVPVPPARFSEFSAVLSTLSSLGHQILDQIRKSAEQERIRGDLERSRLETELRTLRAQMQPHFLFNILNNIGMMISIDPDRAATMITKLSDLYRLILEASKEPLAPLATELRIVEHYLALQEMRFGERLVYRIDAPAEAATIFVPCMMIQTLVENAVKHGIAKSREGGRIEVLVRRVGETIDTRYECRVANTGAPFTTDGKGTGLANTVQRLTLLYGGEHHFQIGHESTGEAEQTVARFFFKDPRA